MSIRKRLVLSNIAMILIPVFLFILAINLFVTIFFGDVKGAWDVINDTKNPDNALVKQEFSQLKKIASLSPEKLDDQNYLSLVNQKLMDHHAYLVVRKGNELTLKTSILKELSIDDLPAFGQEENSPQIQWSGGRHYNIQSYEFYYSDGTEGTIFLIHNSGSIVNNGRKLFPIMFGTLLFILIATNGLLTYFVSKSIIRPVNELMRAAQKITEGDLDFHIESKKKDELGKLSQTFDQMRQKLKESTELQIQYEENRKELVSNISHDLKTPITSIIGHVEGIRDGVANTSEKMNRYLQTIYTKSVNMDKLIDELALYSKLDLNRLPYDFEEVDIKSFLIDLLDELKFDIENEGVFVSFYSEENQFYKVLADREKIKRVITNIINNSLKYMNKDEKQIHITIKVAGENVVVQLQDNGSGITEAALPYIFDRFYRAEPSRNTRTGGSGLGLAIVKRIVEDHGGEIWVESKLNEGTNIFFTIKKSLG